MTGGGCGDRRWRLRERERCNVCTSRLSFVERDRHPSSTDLLLHSVRGQSAAIWRLAVIDRSGDRDISRTVIIFNDGHITNCQYIKWWTYRPESINSIMNILPTIDLFIDRYTMQCYNIQGHIYDSVSNYLIMEILPRVLVSKFNYNSRKKMLIVGILLSLKIYIDGGEGKSFYLSIHIHKAMKYSLILHKMLPVVSAL